MSWNRCGGYPVPGSDREASVAWSILDDLATQPMIHGAIREALYVRLRTLVEQGEQASANQALHGFLDCWALGAMVDDARQSWFDSADPEALAVLVRVAEVIQLAIGWPAGPVGPWPVPDESWFTAKDRTWAEAPSLPIQGVGEVSANDLVLHRSSYISKLLQNEVFAYHVTGEPDDTAAFALALGELRMEAPRQSCFERAGYAALHVDRLPAYQEGWSSPNSGKSGPVLASLADGVVVPALDTGAPMAMVGWIVWVDAFSPRRVHPVAVAALQELDGETPSVEIAAKLEIPLDRWSVVEESLLSIGAATAAL